MLCWIVYTSVRRSENVINLMLRYSLRSSAKKLIITNDVINNSNKSIKIIKRIGPKTDPCGTPFLIVLGLLFTLGFYTWFSQKEKLL